MEYIGLELSDAGIMAVGGDPAGPMQIDGQARESRGYALQQKKRLFVGNEAFDLSRIHPRQTNHSFWAQLSAKPLSGKFAAASSHAEIAYHQLAKIVEALALPASEWVVSVPAFMDEAKLGVLLGVFQELDVQVLGFVPNAVAAVRPAPEAGEIFHVDAHLHRIEIARCSVDGRVELETTEVLSDGGWHELLEQIANGLSAEFVRATRFDPLHHAQVEQQLYSRILPLLRNRIPGDGVPLELNAGKAAYSLSVLPGMLVEASSVVRNQIVEMIRGMIASPCSGVPVAAIYLSHRAALIPGLPEALSSKNCAAVEVLPPGAAALGALALREEFLSEKDSRGATLLTGRPVRVRGVATEPSGIDRMAAPPPPTHVLLGATACPIGVGLMSICLDRKREGIRIGGPEEKGILSIRLKRGTPVLEPTAGPSAFLDDRLVAGPVPLRAGQKIRIEGSADELTLIFVEKGHGA